MSVQLSAECRELLPRTVILTDEKGVACGTADAIEAHTGNGKLHRAFSIFVFRNHRTELLIQKRARGKLLFGGLWANTCCSHPRPGEDTVAAGERRLEEECGFRCALTEGLSFIYRAEDPEGRGVEHEYDTILTGDVPDDLDVHPDPSEIEELRWVKVKSLLEDMEKHPTTYAFWFHKGLRILLATK